MGEDPKAPCTLTLSGDGRALRLPSLRVTARQPDGRTVEAPLDLGPCVVGTGPDCDVVLSDPMVSRRHCELRLTERGISVRDLDSKNGVRVGGALIERARLDPGAAVLLGGTELRVEPAGAPTFVPIASVEHFGEAVGRSVAMRALFARLERVAATDDTVLLLGESGTGKEVLARALHAQHGGGKGPFVVVDCGAIAASVVESELFGHVKGAFTGADGARAGLLEQADGGTLFIDEIGELPLELQPKLLRAIQERKVRRVGDDRYRPFHARIVAATHRDLRRRAQEGAFRADLYYRLAVAELRVPPLRERRDDIPLLVERFLAERDPPRAPADLPPRSLDLLNAYDWPGNVRELRNVVARLLLFPEMASEMFDAPPSAAGQASSGQASWASGDARLDRLLELPLLDAREVVLSAFERAYLTEKLRRYDGNIKRTAQAISVSRQLLHRLVERYDLRGK